MQIIFVDIKQVGKNKSNMEILSQFIVNYNQFKNKETWEMDS